MLIELLRCVAERAPDRDALVAATGTRSYADLVATAEDYARGLTARGIERVGCAVGDPLEVVALLAAASACGAEACVYPRDLDDDGVERFAALLDHDVVLVDRPTTIEGRTALDVAGLGGAEGTLEEPADTPLLILTTGTSGTPKGVRHDWRRLAGGVRRSRDEDGARWLLAYNLNQFAGYQVLLHAATHGATIVVPPSSQARDAIEAMRRHGVTHASATPTFWRLLAGECRDGDPGVALEQITLGGEAASESLIARLRDLFPQARLSHVYAGTEFGSAVAVGDGRGGLPLSVLDRPEDADVRFRVVDGELHVRSRHAMLGYHDAAAGPDDGWIATGDMVEERDGRLHFVGRTVEIINVGGAKVHPLPIEEIVAGVPGVVVASVYGSPNAITGQIVAVDVVLDEDASPEEVVAAIHAACRELPAPGRPRRVKVVEEISTRGNKVLRNASEVSA